ncbi:protein of unknown function (plasmid) [Shinella sp. WSC3-e]|nr:hypothetical protein SHINE37_70055 [Rhizobiaceae bacterium]CAK7260890.1 protein of unknown function [Shinella sp. WSC3-e]
MRVCTSSAAVVNSAMTSAIVFTAHLDARAQSTLVRKVTLILHKASVIGLLGRGPPAAAIDHCITSFRAKASQPEA